VLQRLLEKLQEIRDALDADAVFNVAGEILSAVHVERGLRDFYAGRLGEPTWKIACCANSTKAVSERSAKTHSKVWRRKSSP
jgi:hypothetical protein